MSLSRSHRLTCSTTRAPAGSGSVPEQQVPVPPDAAGGTVPAAEDQAAAVGGQVDQAGLRAGLPPTSTGSRWQFLVLNGSMEGAMIRTRAGGSQAGTYDGREKTNASAGSISGRRNDQAASVSSVTIPDPMWQRQATCTPASRSGATRPAVCGSWSSTTSRDRTIETASAALARLTSR